VFLTKKVGDFNKKESESLDFTGLKIPRDYFLAKEELDESINYSYSWSETRSLGRENTGMP
jgi:hypothetical protein